MKRIITLALAALMICSLASAQTEKETLKERRQISRLSKTELNAKANKMAVKEARALKKEGWKVAPGQLPLEKQLDKSYLMYYEYEEGGLPKYIRGSANAIGSAYDAARMQAINNAKIELAGLIQTEVTALTESTVGNMQISADEATSINHAVQASKTLIAQKLGRVVIVTECYRNVKRNVEVNITLAYNSRMAMEAAKEVIQEQLEAKGEELHKQLDEIWGNLGKED